MRKEPRARCVDCIYLTGNYYDGKVSFRCNIRKAEVEQCEAINERHCGMYIEKCKTHELADLISKL